VKRATFTLLACLFVASLASGQTSNCSIYEWSLGPVSTSGCAWPIPTDTNTCNEAFSFSGHCYDTQTPMPHWGDFIWNGTTQPHPAIATGQCKTFVSLSHLDCPASYWVTKDTPPTINGPTYNKIFLYLYNGVAPPSSISGSCSKSNGPTNFFQCMAKACATHNSPVLLDTTGEGFIGNLTGWEDGVTFDLGDGPERMGWTRKGSGLAFLALPDAEGNVRGPQLFGNHTSQPPSDSPDGFKALAVYDQNKDGKIDAQDPVWPSLVGCVDANHNGIFEKGECIPLDNLGVHSISLDEHKSPRVDPWGNELREWVKIDERADHTAYDIWFTVCPN
jgi:hypothetical protein